MVWFLLQLAFTAHVVLFSGSKCYEFFRFSWKGKTYYPAISNTVSTSISFNIVLLLMSFQKLENAVYIIMCFLVFLETLFDTKYQNPLYPVTSSKKFFTQSHWYSYWFYIHVFLESYHILYWTCHFSAEFISLVTHNREVWKLLFFKLNILPFEKASVSSKHMHMNSLGLLFFVLPVIYYFLSFKILWTQFSEI